MNRLLGSGLVVGLLCLYLPIELLGYPKTPDANLTTGVLCSEDDRHFTGHRYDERIPYCKRRVSTAKKNRIYGTYNVSLECKKFYTIDHLIPLSMGGNNHTRNLWPEHKAIKQSRQNLEFETFQDLRDGLLTQKEAIEIIFEAKMTPPIPEDYPTISINCW